MLASLLEPHIAGRPNDPALIDDSGRPISYAELDVMSRRTAGWLSANGITPGDRVAVWLVNRVEWLALLFGLARIGASLVAVNTRFRSAELETVLERSGARLLILQHGFRKIDFPAVLAGARQAAFRAIDRIAVLDADASTPSSIAGKPVVAFDAMDRTYPPPAECADPHAIAAMFTTSGTTSGPKLVMHTQHTIAFHARHVARGTGLAEPGARLLGVLPLCGVFGFDSTLGAIAAGAPVVLMDTFDGAIAARLVRDERITHVFGADEVFRRMLEAAPGPDPFPSARMFGFAALQPGGADFARDAHLLGLPLVGLYGSSEVHALFSVQAPDLPLDERIAGGGRPVAADQAEVRIRDTTSRALLPAGQSGEIEIRAPSNFVGYYNNPEATAKAIDADGFFRTGDVGHLRADGTFVYETRLGDAMRLGGFLVSPEEIEETMRRIPDIADAQVVAIEIGRATRCVAFVVPVSGAAPREADVIASCAKLMAPFKVPARVWIVDTFPTTPSANGTKIQRGKLREMALGFCAADRTET